MDRSLRQSQASNTWAQLTDEGSKPELLCWIAQATAALTRLKPVWVDKSISLSSKIRLTHSLVTSIFLYACESWTLTAELQRRIQAMEMRCDCKILHISYKDHVTNKEVRAKIQRAIGPHEDLLTIVKRRKLQWYGHVSHSSGPAKTILQGTVKRRRQGKTEQVVGRQHQEMDRPGVRQVPVGSEEQGKIEKTGCKIICGALTTLAVKGLMMMMIINVPTHTHTSQPPSPPLGLP